MKYAAAIDYLFSLQKFGIKLGLDNITRLLELLGNPHKKLRCIHVAGTNGKGSTCAFLGSILKESGCRPGIYTSPHLVDFTERIRVGGRTISRQRVAELTEAIKKRCESAGLNHITFFEFTTAMAFCYFYEQKADPVIVETGLGGRYDATNVIKPLLSIITTISLEHQKYLGKRLADIAFEKAGIIKKNAPVIFSARQKNIQEVFRSRCSHLHAPLYQLGKQIRYRQHGSQIFDYSGIKYCLKHLYSGLKGDFQVENASLAIAASELLQDAGYAVTEKSIISGVRQVSWAGRVEVLQKNPLIILDGAHNPEGWRALRRTLALEFSFKRLIFILGVMEDKNIRQMLKIMTDGAYALIFCRPEMDRAAKKEKFEKMIRFSYKKRVLWVENSTTALKIALSLSGHNDLICVTGSLFLVGEISAVIKCKKKYASRRVPL